MCPQFACVTVIEMPKGTPATRSRCIASSTRR